MRKETMAKNSEVNGNGSLRGICPKLPAIQVVAAMGIILFWVYFFALENSNPPNTDIYLAYERSFPVPDILWIAMLLLISALWLRKGDEKGVITTVASGGAMVFLGLLDISFNVQQSIYGKSVMDAMLNGFINLFCLSFGTYSIVIGWKLYQRKKHGIQ